MVSIFKGDTAQNFIEIEFENDSEFEIYKLIVQCGEIHKEYIEPVSPLIVTLTKEETKKLNYNNFVYVAAEDKEGNKLTADGYATFGAKRQVVEDN